MEIAILDNGNGSEIMDARPVHKKKPFLEANTIEIGYQEIKEQHIIPVFSKNNEPAISHSEFIDTVVVAANDCFGVSNSPDIRISHPIKGRVPEAIHKKANDLLENEKTVYYERMAFMMELDNVYQNIDGSMLKLSVGGVKAFNQDNLYGSKSSGEYFHLFVGFQNTVCTNLCIWTDGLKQKVKVKSLEDLFEKAKELFQGYDAVTQISALEQLTGKSLTEKQFAQLLGRARLYNYLPASTKKQIPQLLISDTQVNAIAQAYYTDKDFPKEEDGSISLWNMYNLFTGANKTSYIDSFLPRGQNSFQFIQSIQDALDQGKDHWFLN